MGGNYAELLTAATREIRDLRARLGAYETWYGDPVAIVGMACRLPGGGDSPREYWRMLLEGEDAVTEIPADRWPARDFYDPDPSVPGKASTKWGGFLKGVDRFEPQAFGISPREAASMDPQQRILLEVAHEALEDACLSKEMLKGSSTGVYVGIYNSDYSWIQIADRERLDTYTASGNGHSIAANRLSYLLDLHGPSMAIDTACSSSLAAVHLACQSLRGRDCSCAIAGGVNLILSPISMVSTAKVLAMAADGRCKAFDSRADGLVRSEGCGVVVLKRLSDALAAGDPIHAVIRGSAMNQDGKSAGLTAPNVGAQQAVIAEALARAGVSPHDVAFIETHGTGTSLGDPIEIEALKGVYTARASRAPCHLGAVKTNLGHCEAAAGVAGLIKTVLVLKHRTVPANRHFTKLNPNISFEGSPFEIPVRPVALAEGAPLYAATSSFGAGGTNVHMVLQSAPDTDRRPAEAPEDGRPMLLCLSAHSDESLRELSGEVARFLRENAAGGRAFMADVAFTASQRRSRQKARLAVPGRDPETWAAALSAYAAGDPSTACRSGRALPGRAGVVFAFSGQGGQWASMGMDLYEREPAFRSKLDACGAIVRAQRGGSLVDELRKGAADSRLGETEIAQPAIFALQVALVELLRTFGIVPDALIGHSVGEIAAAHVAGVLGLEDATRLACLRGSIMQRATGLGRMLHVGAPVEALRPTLERYSGRLSLAAVNGPSATVVSGAEAACEELAAELHGQGIETKRIKVNYAFHCEALRELGQSLGAAIGDLAPKAPGIALHSTVRGGPCREGDFTPGYWAEQLVKPVLFAAAVEAARRDGNAVFLEIGPHPVLCVDMLDSLRAEAGAAVVLPTLRRSGDGALELMNAVGGLYAAGYPLDATLLTGKERRCVRLPTSRWQRERHWSAPSGAASGVWWVGSGATVGQAERPVTASAPVRGTDLDVAALGLLPPDARLDRLISVLRSMIAGALGIPAEKLDVDESVMDVGMDSLAGMQVKTALESMLKLEIPMSAFLEGLSTRQLATRLAAAVEDVSRTSRTVETGSAPRGPEAIDARAAAELLGTVDTMSDAEVERLLAQMQGEERAP
jgi:acyl transferase domain-containing protein